MDLFFRMPVVSVEVEIDHEAVAAEEAQQKAEEERRRAQQYQESGSRKGGVGTRFDYTFLFCCNDVITAPALFYMTEITDAMVAGIMVAHLWSE